MPKNIEKLSEIVLNNFVIYAPTKTNKIATLNSLNQLTRQIININSSVLFDLRLSPILSFITVMILCIELLISMVRFNKERSIFEAHAILGSVSCHAVLFLYMYHCCNK